MLMDFMFMPRGSEVPTRRAERRLALPLCYKDEWQPGVSQSGHKILSWTSGKPHGDAAGASARY